MDRWTIQELAETVNAWCRVRALQPANGQAARELSPRTLHYYRSSGLLDAPDSGAGPGYRHRHFLQLAAIRILQAQGLPLSRIQQLLFGRSDKELKQIAKSVGKIAPGTTNVRPSPLVSSEIWATFCLLTGKSSWWPARPRGFQRASSKLYERFATPLTSNPRKIIDVMNTQRTSTAAFGLVAWLEQTRIHLPLKAVECRFEAIGAAVDVEEISTRSSTSPPTGPSMLPILSRFLRKPRSTGAR